MSPTVQNNSIQRLKWPWLFAIFRVLDNRVALLLATFIYGLLVEYSYVSVISENRIFTRNGFVSYPYLDYSRIIAYIFGLIPALWLSRSLQKPSDVIAIYLYYFAYFPSCIYLTMAVNLPLTDQILFQLMLFICFSALRLANYVSPMDFSNLSLESPIVFEIVLWLLIFLVLGITLILGTFELANLDLENVYERRELLFEEGQVSKIVLYAANWGSLALSPLVLVYGIMKRKYLLIGGAIAVAVVSFGITSFRSQIFVPLFIILVTFVMLNYGRKFVGGKILLVALALCLVPLFFDLVITPGGVLTWTIGFRFIGNNGFLSAQYFYFFQDMPKGLYYDSFGRFFVERRYFTTIAETVGSSFSIEGNHANGNLWADGYGNLGFPGMLFASMSMIALMWLIDSLSVGKNLLMVAIVSVSLAFSISNTAVHSSITSNGGMLMLLLFMLMPKERSNKLAFQNSYRPVAAVG